MLKMSSELSQLVFWKPRSEAFTKEVISKGYGFHTPQDGSVCKIKVLSDEGQLLKEVNDQTKELLVGDVDETIDRIIEDCIRSMKEEEVCQIKFSFPLLLDQSVTKVGTPDENATIFLKNDSENIDLNEMVNDTISTSLSDTTDASKTETLCDSINVEDTLKSSEEFVIKFQLLSYTREPEIWEMSVTEKWRRANYHKQKGLELYARGAYQYAFRRFGLTLKYMVSLEHDVPSGQEDGMDIKGLKLSCYLNIAACQMRHHNFESVVINSSKALLIQPNSAKALYRRGAAHLQIQNFDKAKEDLTKAQDLEPKNQAIAKQLQILKAQVQKLNQYYASAMKKMFS